MRVAVRFPRGIIICINRNMIGMVAGRQPFRGGAILLTDEEE
jgi:delta 1-pyrroline-5-carboxylate dehydrogenase